MPTAVNGQLYYSQDEVQAGLPQYHAALRQATGYTGQFSADPTQKFQQYISGATPEQQAASNALSNIYGSGSFAPGTTTVVQSNQAQQPPDLSPIQTGITGLGTGQQGLMTGQQGLMTGQENLQTGITGLETGQQGLMTGQQNLQTVRRIYKSVNRVSSEVNRHLVLVKVQFKGLLVLPQKVSRKPYSPVRPVLWAVNRL
jgi:hypothetical protein